MSLYKVSVEKNTENKSTRYYSSKQEKSVAKETNSKTNINSGATTWVKGDVSSEKFLIECKTKTSPSESISIKKEWIRKLRQESVFMGKKYEALVFNFGPNEENFAIIDMDLFNKLKEILENE